MSGAESMLTETNGRTPIIIIWSSSTCAEQIRAPHRGWRRPPPLRFGSVVAQQNRNARLQRAAACRQTRHAFLKDVRVVCVSRCLRSLNKNKTRTSVGCCVYMRIHCNSPDTFQRGRQWRRRCVNGRGVISVTYGSTMSCKPLLK